ncbi:hypothetical protein QUA70_03410 [Microcoleus sp. LAD1_D5]|uniref:hypothetical protein n=1 Tax=unclassified Microcoleus TaxID=2642155 RepID=UPI002FD0991F
MKSAAQNQVVHQLKVMETNLHQIQCKLIKTSVLNLWQIVLPDGKRILLEHAGGGHWIFRSSGIEKSHQEVRQAVLRAIGICSRHRS